MNVSHLANQFRLDYQISHMPLDFDQLVDVLRRHFRILRYSEAQAELVKRECFGCTLELGGFALTDEFGQTTIYVSDYINREDCFHLYGKDNLREMTRQDARDEGLRPCTDCRPDDESNENPLEVYSGGFVCIFRF